MATLIEAEVVYRLVQVELYYSTNQLLSAAILALQLASCTDRVAHRMHVTETDREHMRNFTRESSCLAFLTHSSSLSLICWLGGCMVLALCVRVCALACA